MNSTPCDILVIGGGFAGLSVVRALQKSNKYNQSSIVLLEASNRFGGRMKTQYSSKGTTNRCPDVQFECGAWRIPSKHTRMHMLIQSLNDEIEEAEDHIQLIPAPQKGSTNKKGTKHTKTHQRNPYLSKFGAELAQFSSVELKDNDRSGVLLQAISDERAGGYSGV